MTAFEHQYFYRFSCMGQLKPEVHHLSINTSTGLVAWGSSSLK
jgi:hypothetical protein